MTSPATSTRTASPVGATPQAGDSVSQPGSQPLDIFGRPLPEKFAKAVAEFNAYFDTPEKKYEAKKNEWWAWHRANPQVWAAYCEVIDAAIQQQQIPLAPSTVYDTVHRQHKFTRDYSPFYARLANQKFCCQVFNINQQQGESRESFERLKHGG